MKTTFDCDIGVGVGAGVGGKAELLPPPPHAVRLSTTMNVATDKRRPAESRSHKKLVGSEE